MSRIPRILPLLGVAMGGVLAVNALAGAEGLPDLVSGAKAFAEEAGKAPKPAKSGEEAKGETTAAVGEAKDVSMAALPPPTLKPQAVCAPTAAELAKEAGLSPAELQVLQNLGARRGQLDQREQELDAQLALLAAAEAKLDAKIKTLNSLKGEMQALLAQADSRDAAETDRLVKVFESMKPRDAGPRMMLLDDSVRLPIAAKMKERALSAVLAQMPPVEAKKLTEALARRFAAAQALAKTPPAAAVAAQLKAPQSQAPAPRPATARPPGRKSAPAAAEAKAKTPPAPSDPAPAPPAPKAG